VKIVDILLLEGMMFDTLFLFKIYRNKSFHFPLYIR